MMILTDFWSLDGGFSQVMDQSIVVGQLVVAHRHHMLLFRTSKLERWSRPYLVCE